MEPREFEFEAFFYRNLLLTYIKICVGLLVFVILPILFIPQLIINFFGMNTSLNQTLLIHSLIGFPLILFFTRLLVKKFTHNITTTITTQNILLSKNDSIMNITLKSIESVTFEIRENIKDKKAYIITIKEDGQSIYLKAIFTNKDIGIFTSFFNYFIKLLEDLHWHSNSSQKSKRNIITFSKNKHNNE